MRTYDFSDLFVLDLANNHQGDVGHALRIIQEVGQVAERCHARVAFKFQFRDLDTFIHAAHRSQSSNKHVGRFLGTRLNREDFRQLADAVRAAGLIPMATPFDEASLQLIDETGIEIVKIASASATDWPLIERIADSNKPVIFSTGGVSWKEIDDLVSFLDHRRVYHGIMHCVSIYPTPPEKLQLNQIALLRQRYANKTIGFSTHESPEAITPVQVAVAKGAQMFERHVGIETEQYKLNAYSSSPAQVERWIRAAQEARVVCGAATRPTEITDELKSLLELKRGVYARRPIKEGQTISRELVYFAMPCEPGQLSSGVWREGIVSARDHDVDAPLSTQSVRLPAESDKQPLFTAIHSVKAMLNEAGIALNTDFRTEFSHHYGIARFPEVGAILIDCINRSYCKKLVIQLPGQRHPSHYHKRKEEAFQVLWGVLELEIEGRKRTLYPGDIQVVQQGVWHEFTTPTGVIFEEVSTTHHNDDSFYEDKAINKVERSERKTVVNQWGRYQL